MTYPAAKHFDDFRCLGFFDKKFPDDFCRVNVAADITAERTSSRRSARRLLYLLMC